MSRALAAAAMVVALAAPQFAHAQDTPAEKRYTPAFHRCLDTPEGASTYGQIDCVSAELKIQDQALNTAYRKAAADLTPGQKAKLVAAQRAWIAFRDADCASMEDEAWGSLSRTQANLCVLRRTVERTIELEDYPPST